MGGKRTKPSADGWRHRVMTDEEMRDFVLGFSDGAITVSTEVPDNLLAIVFMPLALGALADAPKTYIQEIGVLYADRRRHKMVQRSVNGHPIFVEFAVMSRPDWERARVAIKRELERRKTIEI
jgi:hypothetical protein